MNKKGKLIIDCFVLIKKNTDIYKTILNVYLN